MVIKGTFSKKAPPPQITLPKSTNIYIKTIGALKSKPRLQESLELIYDIANMVGPIMKENGFRVDQLSEFYPNDVNLLGLNINHGWKIKLRLRLPFNENEFLPKYQILGTMLHELTHNLFGPHDSKFHNKLDELIARQEELFNQGIYQLVYQGFGMRLGGLCYGPEHIREARMKKLDRKFTGGVNRLGDNVNGSTVVPATSNDIRDLIRAATLERVTCSGSSSSADCVSTSDKIQELDIEEDDLEILDIRHLNQLDQQESNSVDHEKRQILPSAHKNPTTPMKITPKKIVFTVYDQPDQQKANNADKLEALMKAKSTQPIVDQLQQVQAGQRGNHLPLLPPKKRKGRKTISEKVKASVREHWKDKELPKKRRLEEEIEFVEISD